MPVPDTTAGGLEKLLRALAVALARKAVGRVVEIVNETGMSSVLQALAKPKSIPCLTGQSFKKHVSEATCTAAHKEVVASLTNLSAWPSHGRSVSRRFFC